MKRSEMVNMILSRLQWPQSQDPKENASDLLRMLEKRGMLPPFSDPEDLYNRALADDHVWEEENE